ncbi:DUF6766 family protein [Chryseobacterium sp. NRRL B-14859]
MRLFYHNGLSLALSTLMILSFTGQALTGWSTENKELTENASSPYG